MSNTDEQSDATSPESAAYWREQFVTEHVRTTTAQAESERNFRLGTSYKLAEESALAERDMARRALARLVFDVNAIPEQWLPEGYSPRCLIEKAAVLKLLSVAPRSLPTGCCDVASCRNPAARGEIVCAEHALPTIRADVEHWKGLLESSQKELEARTIERNDAIRALDIVRPQRDDFIAENVALRKQLKALSEQTTMDVPPVGAVPVLLDIYYATVRGLRSEMVRRRGETEASLARIATKDGAYAETHRRVLAMYASVLAVIDAAERWV